MGQTAIPRQQPVKHMQMLQRFLNVQQNRPVAKATAGTTAQRVIAQSTRDNTLASLSDSVQLQYTGNHTSIYDYNMMLYPYNYPYSTSPMFNYMGVFTKPRVLFDDYAHWTVNPFTNVYGLYEGTTATYDASNNLTNFQHLYADSVTNKNTRYSNSFDAMNRIATGYWYNEHSGINDSAFQQYFTYNTAGKLVKDSIFEYHLGVWRIAGRTLYTYDGSGNLTQIDNYGNVTDTSFLLPLTEQEQYINTYDATGRLLTVLTSLYNGTALDQSIKDTFAYSGTLAYHNSWKQYQYDLINHYWAPMTNMMKHINAANLPDTVNIMGFDSLLNAWVPGFKDVVHYNSNNKPDTIWDYGYTFTSFPSSPDFTTVYYYEDYTDYTGVANTAANASNVLVYPNPSSGSVAITQLQVKDGAAINIALVNMEGQLVSSSRVQWHGSATVSLAGLVPGIYRLLIRGTDGKLLCSEAIERQ